MTPQDVASVLVQVGFTLASDPRVIGPGQAYVTAEGARWSLRTMRYIDGSSEDWACDSVTIYARVSGVEVPLDNAALGIVAGLLAPGSSVGPGLPIASWSWERVHDDTIPHRAEGLTPEAPLIKIVLSFMEP